MPSSILRDSRHTVNTVQPSGTVNDYAVALINKPVKRATHSHTMQLDIINDSHLCIDAPQGSTSVATFSQLTSGSNAQVSNSERKYIEDGITMSYRLDGRALLDFRPVTIETNIIPSAAGSVRVISSDAELVVAVKAEIHTCAARETRKGIVICHVDCSPLVSMSTNRFGNNDISQYITQLVNQYILNSFTIDRQKLCIDNSRLVWKVLSGEGNLLDIVSKGIRAALLNTLLPSVTCVPGYNEDTENAPVEFTIDERPEMGRPFPCDKIPIFVTAGQIRSRFVWDMSPAETTCSTVRLAVAVSRYGRCHGVHKTGNTTLSLNSIMVAVKNSCRIAKSIHQDIEETVMQIPSPKCGAV